MEKTRKSHFTNHQIETAILVLMESAQVRNWVESQAKFLGVNLKTPEGEEFWLREARAAAQRLIS